MSTTTDSRGSRRASPPGSPGSTSRRRRPGLGSAALGRAFLAPSAVLMTIVLLFPIAYAFVLSLGAYDGRTYEGFAGFANYAEALSSARFWAAIRSTAVFTLTSVSAEFALGMAFALVMNQASRGRGATRAVILVPWVIPTVVAAQMWSILFNVQPGFVNSLLGLGSFNWLGREGWAMAAIVFADVWKTAPFVALLLLAGLQTIPGELYESAALDGAGAWRRFLHITLPLLRPAILVALLFRTVQALRVFDLPQVMTFGEFGTESLSILVQQYVVRTVDLGYGSALSTLTFIVVLAVGVLFVSALGRDAVLADRRG